MPDFGALLRKPATGQTRPTVFAIADYPGIITKFEVVKPNPKFEIPVFQIRVFARITGLPEGLTNEDVGGNPIGVTLRRDYDFQTENGEDAARLWQLNSLLESVGCPSGGGTYEELLPQLQGKPVLISISQYIDKKTGEVAGNDIAKMAGFEANR